MEFYSLLVIISYTIQHNNYAYSIYTIDITKNQDGIYIYVHIYTHIWGYMEAIRKHNIIFCETWASADMGVFGVLGATLNGDWNDEYVLGFWLPGLLPRLLTDFVLSHLPAVSSIPVPSLQVAIYPFALSDITFHWCLDSLTTTRTLPHIQRGHLRPPVLAPFWILCCGFC